MSGLRKAKKYDWKDSNLALFGSDTEKQVKKDSAKTEPAWQGAGAKPGLKIWRIVKFKVVDWPKEDYGKFYNGDSYIILNTYKEEDNEQLQHDVHFWIGKYSSQDEYGTAAYKTVELDTFLDDVPVQHREVQGHESEMFKSYFDDLTYLSGGADTGFRHVSPVEYKPRLFHFCGTRKHVTVKEVPLKKDKLKSDDVFILDNGLTLYQWNGSQCNKDEKFKASQYLSQLRSQRGGKPSTEVLEEDSTAPSHPFFDALQGETFDDDDDDDEDTADRENKLFRLSDASGKMQFSEVKTGSISEGDLDTKDVFIVDTKPGLFVWIGKGTSTDEKKNALAYAHNYLQNTSYPFAPVSCIKEGQESKTFKVAISA